MMSIKNRSFRFVVLQVSLLLLPVVSAFFVSSCRMAPKDNPGDTVASSQFYPPDTALLHRQRQADSAVVAQQPDSIDIFYVGEGVIFVLRARPTSVLWFALNCGRRNVVTHW